MLWPFSVGKLSSTKGAPTRQPEGVESRCRRGREEGKLMPRKGLFAGQGGFTLVEMLVALAIVSVVLTATAASLITFTQTARQNERQVQATALLNSVHERFQGQSWDTLGTLPSHLADDGGGQALSHADHLGAALELNDIEEWLKLEDDETPGDESEPMTFTGEDGEEMEIVVTGDEDSAIPAYDPAPVTADGRDYELYQIVTWVDRTGDGNPDLKRLTAIVRWDVVGRPYEQVFVSDRAPSVQEAGDPAFPRLLQYDIFPRNQFLDDAGFSQQPIDVVVRFSQGVKDVQLQYYRVDEEETGDPPVGPGEVVLEEAPPIDFGFPLIDDPSDPDSEGGVYFTTVLPAEAGPFPVGARPIRVVATTADGETFTAGSRDVTFHFENGDAPYPATPDPGSGDEVPDDNGEPSPSLDVTTPQVAAPANPVGLDNVAGSRVLCGDITVSFNISGGLEPEDDVVINYFVGNQGNTPASRTVTNLTVAGGAADVSFTFDKGTDYGFRNGTSTAFTANVRRDGTVIGSATSDHIVEFINNNNC